MTSAVRILLVEDDPSYEFALSHLLGRRGFLVRSAATVEGALRIAAEWGPAAAVIDLMLPPTRDIEGIRLAQELRDTRTIPVLLLTNRVEEDVLAMASGAADAVLQKSAGGTRIVETLQKLCGMRLDG